MKRTLIALILAAAAATAYAQCRNWTVMLPDGRLMFCSQCNGGMVTCL